LPSDVRIPYGKCNKDKSKNQSDQPFKICKFAIEANKSRMKRMQNSQDTTWKFPMNTTNIHECNKGCERLSTPVIRSGA
jgi:hypothetical protein